jgi:hypothetical protein
MFLNLKSNFPVGTKLFANWMGWFNGTDGKKHAANVCQSDDPQTVHNQVLAAHAVGIDGFVVDWYGAARDYAPPTNAATILLAAACTSMGMEFSIMLDSGTFKWAADKKAAFAAGLAYCKSKFFTMPNYTKLNGKPLLWEFGWKENGINISEVAVANPDMAILAQNASPPSVAGSFAWVNGFGTVDAPQKYMEWYLAKKDPVMVPCVFDGFDDHDPIKITQSRWGGPARFIAYGQWQMCIDEIKKAIAAGAKFPFVQICTWNDYDERTQIESQCLDLERLRLY